MSVNCVIYVIWCKQYFVNHLKINIILIKPISFLTFQSTGFIESVAGYGYVAKHEISYVQIFKCLSQAINFSNFFYRKGPKS